MTDALERVQKTVGEVLADLQALLAEASADTQAGLMKMQVQLMQLQVELQADAAAREAKAQVAEAQASADQKMAEAQTRRSELLLEAEKERANHLEKLLADRQEELLTIARGPASVLRLKFNTKLDDVQSRIEETAKEVRALGEEAAGIAEDDAQVELQVQREVALAKKRAYEAVAEGLEAEKTRLRGIVDALEGQ